MQAYRFKATGLVCEGSRFIKRQKGGASMDTTMACTQASLSLSLSRSLSLSGLVEMCLEM